MDFFEDNLIELVRNYPSLYKNKDKKHKSLIIKETCWREIAVKLNKTPEECKNKWRNIRDNYRKNLNKKKTGNAASVSKYDHERLQFINDGFEERESIPNLNPGNDLEVKEENNLPGIISAVRRPLMDEDLPTPTPSLPIRCHLHPPAAGYPLDVIGPPCEGALGQNLPVEIEISSGPPTFSTPNSPCESIIQQPSQGHSVTPNKTQGTSQVKRKKRDSLFEEFRRTRKEGTNMLRLRQITKKDNTPVHTFFKSMADVVCQFPPDKIAQIRAQVCNIVTEMELLVLEQRERPSPQQSFNTPQQTIHAYNSQLETSPQNSTLCVMKVEYEHNGG